MLLGFALPPQIGLFFVTIKPQVGIGVVFFWLGMAWEKGKLKEVGRVFLPITIASLVSFILYGFWFLDMQSHVGGWNVNASLWPYAIPVGIYLLCQAVRRKSLKLSAAASP